MKKCALLLLLFFIQSIASIAETYIVTAETLNMRDEPSKNGQKIAVMHRGDRVWVESGQSNGQWVFANYGGRTGYVSTAYLQLQESNRAPVAQQEKSENRIKKYLEGLNIPSLHDLFSNDSKWLVYVILLLGWLIAGYGYYGIKDDDDDESLRKGFIYFLAIAFIALCCLEIYYFSGYNGDVTWFCSPDKVGWIMTIVNFFIYGAMLVGQFAAFLHLLSDLDYVGGRYSYWIVCFGAIGASIVLLILGIFFDWAPVAAGYLFVGSQLLWPVWLVISNIRSQGSWINLALTYSLYILGAVALLLCVIHFIPLLIVAVVGFIGVAIIGHGGSSQTSSSSDSNIVGYVNDGGARRTLQQGIGDNMIDDLGREWKREAGTNRVFRED